LHPAASWKGKGKRKDAEGMQQLRSSNKVAKVIPHHDMDLATEKQSSVYQNELSCFLQQLWDMRWVGLNKWEICRVLGKERYCFFSHNLTYYYSTTTT
jgi:hypothetical protein